MAHSPTQSKKQANKKIRGGGGYWCVLWEGGIFIWLLHCHPPPQTFFKGFIIKYIFFNFPNNSLEDAVFKSRMHFLSRLGPGRQYREDLHKIGGLRSISQLIEWNGTCLLILTY